MPKNMLLRCFILCCSLSLLTACSNRPIRPSVQLYKPDFSKVKNTFNRYTARIPRMSLRAPKLRKPKLREPKTHKKYPVALPLRRVASKKVNTCPTPALRQAKVQTNRAQVNRVQTNRVQTNRVQTKQITQPRVATVPATRQTTQYSSRIRTVAHTQPVQAPRPINVSQANAALFDAAKSGNTQHVSSLLSQGANVNASNANGETALHAAASRDQVAVAQLLIQRGANINSQTTQGWTPLHSAARFGKTAVTQLLINRNAQNLRNNQGKTAIQLALQTKQHATVQILKAGRGG